MNVAKKDQLEALTKDVAEACKLQLDALMLEGFTREEAHRIVVVIAAKLNK